MTDSLAKMKRKTEATLQDLDADTTLCAISTFSGGGIGDAGVEWGSGVPVISACELEPERAGLIRHNYPATKIFEGDIWQLKSGIISYANHLLDGKKPWLFIMSPPCQGMSSNGAGRIRKSMAEGRRPKEDIRNRLVLPGVEIIESLHPDWFIVENVQRMENTIISNENGEAENILDLLGRRLHPIGYTIKSAIIDFRDLGVPHHRKRLITIGCKVPSVVALLPPGVIFSKIPSMLHPVQTHGGERQPSHVSLRDAIGHMPKLDARSKTVDENDPYHHVPNWPDHHYYCMAHTPEGNTAFDNNSCPECGYAENERSDIDCKKCGTQLPKPLFTIVEWVCSNCGNTNRKTRSTCQCGAVRNKTTPFRSRRKLVSGFNTSYRRLKWNSPASTITMNSGVISSDNKGHPDQNRVLSVRELLLLSTLEAHPGAVYPWHGQYAFRSVGPEGEELQGGAFSPKLVRQVIGESIPPLAMHRMVSRLKMLDPRVGTVEMPACVVETKKC